MATAVYTQEEIELQDGVAVILRPLVIKTLRKFMVKIDEFAKAENEDEGLDKLLDAAAMCLAKQQPQYFDAKTETHTEEFEDVADMPTIYKILEVCGGVKLNDPNLLAAAAEVLTGQN